MPKKLYIPKKGGTPAKRKPGKGIDYSKMSIEQREKSLQMNMIAVAAASKGDINEALGVVMNATLKTLHSVGLVINNKDTKKADAFVEQVMTETLEQIKNGAGKSNDSAENQECGKEK